MATSVDAVCDATLGPPTANEINVVFVFDVSASMISQSVAVPDCNGNGVSDRIDAACLGFESLLTSFGSGTNVDVGLVIYASRAESADMSPAPGIQLFADSPVFRGATRGAARLFTNAVVYGPGFGARHAVLP